MKKNSLFALIGVTVLIIVVAVLFKPEEKTQASKQTGEYFVAGLLDKLNDIERITVASRDDTFDLILQDDKTWGLITKNNYPVKVEDVRKLLVGTANMKKIEPKTKNPKLYAKLDVGKIDKDSASTLVTLYNGKEKVAQYYLGKRHGKSSNDEMYVRMKGDAESWLVSEYVSVNKSPLEWLKKEVSDIDSKRIHSVTVTPNKGEAFTVYKDSYDESNFKLQDLPKGKEIQSAFMVNDVANTLGKIKLEDVTTDNTKDPNQDSLYSAVMETFGGMRVSMHVKKIDEKYYAKLEAQYDESLIKMPEPEKPVQTADDKKSADREAAKKAADKKKAREKAMAAYNKKVEERKKMLEQAKTDAAKYAKEWAKWTYVISEPSATAIGKQKQDLYKKEEEKNNSAAKKPAMPKASPH